MAKRGESLFAEMALQDALDRWQETLGTELNDWEPEALLSASLADLLTYFQDKYMLEAPELQVTEIEVDHEDVRVDVSKDSLRPIIDRSRPVYVNGTKVTFIVPFLGEAQLFHNRPSTSTSSYPRGIIENQKLLLSYTLFDHDHDAARRDFERDLAHVEQWLTWVRQQVTTWNASVHSGLQSRIEARRQKLLADKGMAEALGFPLRRRPDAPQTYVAPTVRRKSPVSRPQSAIQPFEPEPTLAMDEYEHILGVICNMVSVMERSPRAFKGMGEEDLRQHFLVQLNGHYEGQASGETFNYGGKTDILIRAGDKNIFIAECKFWKGPEHFSQMTDQLLSYATWRDGKLALLVFNRNKNLSDVLARIPVAVAAHACYKRAVDYSSERGFRYVFRHPDDANRELLLTTLVFEIPV